MRNLTQFASLSKRSVIRSTTIFLVLATLVPMFVVPATASATEPSDADTSSSQPCDLSVGDEELECGTFTVPENWNNPESVSNELTYAILPALSKRKSKPADPIIYLEGGPGVSGLAGIGFFNELTKLRETRDIIFMEYRGVGLSKPSFPCTLIDLESETEVQNCWDETIDAGMNPAHYNTKNFALDAQHLRKELGIEQWNVWGISYGTTTAQLLSDVDPEGTRTVTLDSPTSPSVEIVRADLESQFDYLSLISTKCETDSACNNAYPNLKTAIEQTYTELTTTPWEHGSEELDSLLGPTVDGDLFIEIILFELPPQYQPAAIAAFQARNTGQILQLAELVDEYYAALPEPAPVVGLPPEEELYSDPMHLSVYCAEETPYYDLDTNPLITAEVWPEKMIQHLTQMLDLRQTCKNWDVPAAKPEDVDLVKNDIPTLILTGEYDALTPIRQGQIVQSGLTNATLIDVPSTGHGVVPQQPCAQKIMANFIKKPAKTINQRCVNKIQPIEFVTNPT